MHRIVKIAAGTAGLAAAALMATSTAANAAVTVNEDGSGFIGKGDVQTALHYNNKQMQDAAASLSAKFSQTRDLSTTFRWTTSDGVEHSVVRTEHTIRPLSASIARENSNGKDGPLTGWNLVQVDGARWAYTATPLTYTGEDMNNDGKVTQADVYKGEGATPVDADGDGIPDAPFQQFTFGTQIDGNLLPNTPVV